LKKILFSLFLIYINTFSFSIIQNLNGVNTAITITNQYPDYPATPGDIYEISFLTVANSSQVINAFVDLNYNIDLSFIGTVNVKGLIYSDVQKILKKKIISAYPGSIVNVAILQPGKFKVTLLGEVEYAEIIEAMSLTTLLEAINDKTTEYASLRNIEIRSEDGSINTYDLFQFTRFANVKHNPFLKPNDIITIRPFNKSVKISGSVKRPGLYQLLEDETLYDLINILADGFTSLADESRIEVLSVLDNSTEYNDKSKYVDGKKIDLHSVSLNNMDKIIVNSQNQYSQKVIIQGAITTEGNTGDKLSNKIVVPLIEGSKVSTIIHEMDAIFNLSSDIEKAFILRDGTKTDVNLRSISDDRNSEYNIVMKDNDILVIPFRQLHVFVSGHVNKSGSYPFIENRKASYYIGLAGGFNKTNNLFGSYSVTNVYGEKLSGDAIIGPEDVIWVNRDNPLSYISEYGSWLTTIISAIVVSSQLVDILTPVIEYMLGLE